MNAALASKAMLHDFEKRQDSVVLHNAKRLAFSLLVTGSNYSSMSEMLLWNDIIPLFERTFNRARNEVVEKILGMATEFCSKYKEKMTINSTIAMDRSWSHRRNANECVLEFVDLSQKNNVDFEFPTKDNHSITGDYTGSSNGMEIDCLKKMIKRWKNNNKVISYSNDRDGKTKNVMKEMSWVIAEIIDLNHAMKSFRTSFTSFNKATKMLHGLKEKWLYFFEGFDLQRRYHIGAKREILDEYRLSFYRRPPQLFSTWFNKGMARNFQGTCQRSA